ncbi:unnamed protein product [Ambrosiozyma monospora]|uniref:Unnamed protein product n=1 Tax=Ambrosiozyma monospora TaxID=43982 RepID=A0ACB5U7Q6_AMBMO|nr:unnamed protein product [Ambrosiozyma monospora]
MATNAIKNGRSDMNNSLRFGREIEEITADNNNRIKLEFKEVEKKFQSKTQEGEQTQSERLVSEIMVQSNHIAARFLSRNNIPGLFKHFEELPVSESVKSALRHLKSKNCINSQDNIKNNNSSFKDALLLREFMTKSALSVEPARHAMLNLDSYATQIKCSIYGCSIDCQK